MLTTRDLTPSFLSRSWASTHIETSEPVARSRTSGLPPSASAMTYAPLATPAGGGVLGAVERRAVLAREDEADGVMAELHDDPPASATSLASPGRIVIRPGMARRRGHVLDGLVRRAVFADADASRG